jgi:hypothetical protein
VHESEHPSHEQHFGQSVRTNHRIVVGCVTDGQVVGLFAEVSLIQDLVEMTVSELKDETWG